MLIIICLSEEWVPELKLWNSLPNARNVKREQCEHFKEQIEDSLFWCSLLLTHSYKFYCRYLLNIFYIDFHLFENYSACRMFVLKLVIVILLFS